MIWRRQIRNNAFITCKCNTKKKSVLRSKTIRIGNFVASVFQFLAFGMSRKVRQSRRSGRQTLWRAQELSVKHCTNSAHFAHNAHKHAHINTHNYTHTDRTHEDTMSLTSLTHTNMKIRTHLHLHLHTTYTPHNIHFIIQNRTSTHAP